MSVSAEPLHCAECGAPLSGGEEACWMCRRKLDDSLRPASIRFHNPSLGVTLHTKATRWVLVFVILAAVCEGIAFGRQGAYFSLIGVIPALISLAFVRGAVSTARQRALLVEQTAGTPSALGRVAETFDFALKAGVVLALAGLALTFALCATCFFAIGLGK